MMLERIPAPSSRSVIVTQDAQETAEKLPFQARKAGGRSLGLRRDSLQRVVLLGCLLCTFCEASWNISPKGRVSAPAIVESSGTVVSRRFENVLWTHNDAHNPPEIFAVTERGKLIQRYSLVRRMKIGKTSPSIQTTICTFWTIPLHWCPV